MNNYRTFKKGDTCVIHFTGEIGGFWREGKIEISIKGLTEDEINRKVLETVEKNKYPSGVK